MKKKMIFGAGFYGQKAFARYGSKEVDYFIDNDKDKEGSLFCGKEVITPKCAAEMKDDYHIVIASLYASSMSEQLDELGVSDYSFFISPIHGMFETDELILNPYISNPEANSEKDWSDAKKLEYSRNEVNHLTAKLYAVQPLFDHVEIETVNRCNGVCSFCPVSKNADTREYAKMSEKLFKVIVDQLEEIQYSGRFSTFSNNEPLLDERIIDFNRYAREHLPKARMHLYTNGTLLTLDKFLDLIEVLDELVIDNYQQELKLIKPCKEIKEYCERHPELELNKKVTILLRKPHEILTSRGGDAPNRHDLKGYPDDRCVLPFRQMIIRPTGKVSLCCNDALGKYTLGDVSKEKLTDIWYGPKFTMVRKCLYEGRVNWGNCKYCDTFITG